VYQGYLFVLDQLLSESGMRHHPVTPMTDSNLLRLMEAQAQGRCGLVTAAEMDCGASAVVEKLQQLAQQSVRYAVLDTLNEQHLLTQGEALKNMKLVTGGSGLAIGLARQWAQPGQGRPQAAGAHRGRKRWSCPLLLRHDQSTGRSISSTGPGRGYRRGALP
jgi:3-dehydrotetronate 4-kinase